MEAANLWDTVYIDYGTPHIIPFWQCVSQTAHLFNVFVILSVHTLS